MTKDELDALIARRFASLTPKLRAAARHVLDSPKDVALQSMRSVAAQAQLQPATMVRLARELGFDSYEHLRAIYVNWLSSGDTTFSTRAKSLRTQKSGRGQQQLLTDIYDMEIRSLDKTLGATNTAAFDAAKTILLAARRFYILGLRSLFPAASYLDYACRLFLENGVLISGIGGTVGDELRRAGSKDALVAFSFAQYAQLTVDTVRYAAERRLKIIAITDSTVSPIAEHADVILLAPNTGISLFPSIVPAVVVAHALASLMIAAGGAKTHAEIGRSEDQLKRLRAYADR